MNHQETPQTNPMAQWDPLDVSLNPLGPPGPPPLAHYFFLHSALGGKALARDPASLCLCAG